MAAKRKTSKKAASKRKNIKNLSQAHGKEEKFEPTTLDQIWGDDGFDMYGTMKEEEYENQIDDMNMSDLQTHASRVGIIQVDNRITLRDMLVREFRKHVTAYRKPTLPPNTPKPLDSEAMKILSEGR